MEIGAWLVCTKAPGGELEDNGIIEIEATGGRDPR